MTTSERKRFDELQRRLSKNPSSRMSFFANVTGIEQPELANNPYDNWARRATFENKAICMYLGIEYNEDDFTTSGEALARSWAQSLPGKE